jgi:hypothetical protein
MNRPTWQVLGKSDTETRPKASILASFYCHLSWRGEEESRETRQVVWTACGHEVLHGGHSRRNFAFAAYDSALGGIIEIRRYKQSPSGEEHAMVAVNAGERRDLSTAPRVPPTFRRTAMHESRCMCLLFHARGILFSEIHILSQCTCSILISSKCNQGWTFYVLACSCRSDQVVHAYC